MNCKEGDIARIVHSGRYYGWLVKVLYMSRGRHRDPSGNLQDQATTGTWLCESLCSEFTGHMSDGSVRVVRHACIDDMWPRPIRDPGDDAVDEMVQRLGSPRLEGVPCQ